jgi:hypothetical protein
MFSKFVPTAHNHEARAFSQWGKPEGCSTDVTHCWKKLRQLATYRIDAVVRESLDVGLLEWLDA